MVGIDRYSLKESTPVYGQQATDLIPFVLRHKKISYFILHPGLWKKTVGITMLTYEIRAVAIETLQYKLQSK